jgi:hypothetical protein
MAGSESSSHSMGFTRRYYRDSAETAFDGVTFDERCL